MPLLPGRSSRRREPRPRSTAAVEASTPLGRWGGEAGDRQGGRVPPRIRLRHGRDHPRRRRPPRSADPPLTYRSCFPRRAAHAKGSRLAGGWSLEVLTLRNLHKSVQVFLGKDRPRVSAALSSSSPSEANLDELRRGSLDDWISSRRDKQRSHRLERAIELCSIARETEPDIALAVRAEVDSRDTSNASSGDQEFGHGPREGAGGTACVRPPRRIDFQERIESAPSAGCR